MWPSSISLSLSGTLPRSYSRAICFIYLFIAVSQLLTDEELFIFNFGSPFSIVVKI